MKDLNFLTTLSDNLYFINKEIIGYPLTIQDYKQYGDSLLKNLNEFIQINNELLRNIDPTKELSEDLKNKLINCELEAWQIYCSFMRNNIQASFKHLFLRMKNFRKDSDYKLNLIEINSLRKKIQNKSNTLKPIEILEQYRLLGKKYKNLDDERVVKNWMLFWTALGVIGVFITAGIMIFK